MTAKPEQKTNRFLNLSVLSLSAFALVACGNGSDGRNLGSEDSLLFEVIPGGEGTKGIDGQLADGGIDSATRSAGGAEGLAGEVEAGRISDEQDFDAVADRETIESDAARLKQQREAYVEVRVVELPKRRGKTAPNVVEFALSTRNSVGEQIWPRGGFLSMRRYQTNCAKYVREEFAQEAFLANGGPRRNWRGLDPDGDGFACGWDPTPIRDSVAAGG